MSRREPNSGPAEAPRRLVTGGGETPEERAIGALLSRLPPAVPNDLAVERVWRRVASPGKEAPRRSMPLWVPAATLLAFLAIFFAAPRLLKAPPAAELALSSGGVFEARPAETWRAAQKGDSLLEGERVRTDEKSHALFRIRGVSAVLLGEDSEVGVERIMSGTFLRLSHGTLTARVAKRRADDPFVVQTDRYAVKVVGTLFTVEVGPGDHTAVSVREGVVEVSDGAHVYRVFAGTRWAGEAADARQLDGTPEETKTLLEGGLLGVSSSDLQGYFAALLEKSNAPHTEARAPSEPREETSESGVDSVRKSDRLPGPTRETPSSRPSAPTPRGEPPLNDAIPSSTPPGPAVEVRALPPGSASSQVALPEPSAAISEPAPPSESAFAKGRALEAKGDLEGAARAFATAADEDKSHGDLALYSLGRLAQKRLHDPKRALSAFRRYRTQYPSGALLPEVDLAILELEVEGHEQGPALEESTRFLAKHPESERVDQVHVLRGNLLRDEGRCQEAIDDYAAVRSAALADDALYSTAYCQRRLGDRARAAATLHEYLKRFPGGAHRKDAERAIESGNEVEKNF
jgi:tetratricopeptide (TPR) repeat protein